MPDKPICCAHSMEEVKPEGGGPPFNRPVVRLPELGLVFTRIAAERRETSMIMHIRPGWPGLRDYLRPQMDMSTGYCSATIPFHRLPCHACTWHCCDICRALPLCLAVVEQQHCHMLGSQRP